MARFFIDRPVFAWVLAIITMMAGILAIYTLPIEQYPKVAPPTVTITATYPGASAETVENSVTQVVEQNLSGIDNLRYFSASSSNSSMSISLTFEPGTDPDIAQVQTQNKVQAALPLLPAQVQQQGVTVAKSNSAFSLAIGFYDETGQMSQYDLSDLLVSQFRDSVSRVNGVGSVRVFGAQRSMRIWLDPDKLYSYNLTPVDVQAAVEVQNTDVSAGQLGGLPAIQGQQINATIQAQSRLQTVDDFESIVLRVNTDGSQVRVRDVARVELGAESYDVIVRYDRHPASGMAISLASGANALDTINAVKQRVEELRVNLPDSVKVVYPVDASPFIELSIESVVHTLIEAVVLVFFVMLLFLQNWRATLIPTIAVPVVLLGTFAVLLAFGYSINVLTMFAMVLAIGLLVDDAIVVVENVERIMEEEGLPPAEATKKSMTQITGALVGIAAVLSTVFIPMAFFSGSAGAIYRQFSITIVSAMGFSVLVAIILSPSLCATLLKQHDPEHNKDKGFFGWFNRTFNKGRDRYQRTTTHMAKRAKRYFAVYGILVAGMAYIFAQLPGAFLPDEDQGRLMVLISTPPGATAGRTLESVKKAEDFFLDQEQGAVNGLFTVVGFSFAGQAQNAGMGFVNLNDWSVRDESDSAFALVGRAFGAFSQIEDASAFPIVPPPIMELGNATGFDMQLVDRGSNGHVALMNARNQLLGMAAQNPKLAGVRPNGLSDVPQFKVNIDSEKASALGLNLSEINSALQIAWGSSYVNDFIDKGRIKRVYMQADAQYRMSPDDLDKWFVRNADGDMVAFSTFASTQWVYGSPKLERFNGISSVNIQGSPAEGISSGEAMEEMEKLVAQLPDGYAIEWSGLSFEEQQAGSQAPMLYAISILIVFLCLAALYESWSVPFAVMLVVPLGILGSVTAAFLFNLPNDVYLQVAFLTTVGLAAKNAILIVEFAKDQYEEGIDLMTAVSNAASQRFRPILMTSMAFILGVTPLALASGAGSASQNAIGIAVMGGMFAATFLAIFFVPMFYVMVEKLFHKQDK
ncbi:MULTISPECIES: efflux RND transporter permease subunit [Alteromonas]|jgi:multidrug efflux pump|uniref:Efflux pump membrane transporter n=2 Tax=Alteromonas stellipolaris TaxID=233316 RepID=A0AAW7Z381_9ALTE|nr:MULTISPECIES: efflux RND transporter permease subunit [Alteromonas]AMJ89158.1 multidrug transporter [Alteromonas sp. Mac2]ALM92328.1 RND efflux system, inner membrane transporter CmeB [Alteromonas stellipolaris LMG 21856]AMJ72879.1 multidrug transporter [Alteromonas stellipolaris]AMJ85272.1 multidrug transporter [Alteromonas sp. Mac1]AMJ93010.1 multidrug transporter [Alteromonas stellipolaris]